MKEIARLFEWIKYVTLIKSGINFTTNANVDKSEHIKSDKNISLPGYINFTVESIIIDYGADVSKTLKTKEQSIKFLKKPIDVNNQLKPYDDPDGLITPTICDDYIKNGVLFKRYVFFSDQSDTYSFQYENYNQWYNNNVMDSASKNFTNSMTILIDHSNTTSFAQYLNESLQYWRIRFNNAVDLAKSGNFYWFSLYDHRIYNYELSKQDRKIILDKLVLEDYWGILDNDNVDEYELFKLLIIDIVNEHALEIYNHMFTIDTVSQKTYLKLYQEKLNQESYNFLMIQILKWFYSTISIQDTKTNFSLSRLYPIGFYSDSFNINNFYFTNNHNLSIPASGILKLGVEYVIDESYLPQSVKVVSSLKYNYNNNRAAIEIDEFQYIGKNQVLNANSIVYITPYLAFKKFEGISIPYGSIIPIPAFVLKWFDNVNTDFTTAMDIIKKVAIVGGFIFPFFKVVEGIEVAAGILSMGTAVFDNFLDAGLENQINDYDNSHSTQGNPCTSGRDFLAIYTLITTLYGIFNLGKALKSVDSLKEKAKIFVEFENVLEVWNIANGTSSLVVYMHTNHPDNQKFNEIKQQMFDLNTELNKYNFLKK